MLIRIHGLLELEIEDYDQNWKVLVVSIIKLHLFIHSHDVSSGYHSDPI